MNINSIYSFNKNNHCGFNSMIDCAEHDCSKCNNCGWNPDVAKKRIENWKIEQKQKIYECE